MSVLFFSTLRIPSLANFRDEVFLLIDIAMKCAPLLGDVDISDYTGLFDKFDHEKLLLKYSF